MPDKVTYYAIVNELSSREGPTGVFRRTYFESGGKRDEAFTTRSRVGAQRVTWSPPSAAILHNEFIEITEDEANQIVERIRAKVTGASST